MKFTKEDLIKAFRENLQKHIEYSKKNPRTICEEIHIPYPTFMQWIEGRAYPSNERISVLADYFNVPMSELIQESQVIHCHQCRFYNELGICEHFSKAPDASGTGYNVYTKPKDYCSYGKENSNG